MINIQKRRSFLYYIFSKGTDVFYAVMEEEYDDNCIFKEYMGFIRN